MKYHFKIKKERSGGYWAECIELTGCHTQGDTLQQLRTNVGEALNLYLAEPEGSKVVFPKPQKGLTLNRNLIAVDVDPKVAFAVMMRNIRLTEKLTQNEMKARLGIKHLSDYQRLEDPRRANPRLLTLKKIKNAFPSLRVDDILAA